MNTLWFSCLLMNLYGHAQHALSQEHPFHRSEGRSHQTLGGQDSCLGLGEALPPQRYLLSQLRQTMPLQMAIAVFLLFYAIIKVPLKEDFLFYVPRGVSWPCS